MIDLALDDDFSLSITNGDFTLVDNFDTSMKVALFSDKRADESEVLKANKRRGWWGNPFNDIEDFELGSKLWLLQQSRLTNDTINRAISYAKDALQWLVTDNFADEIKVSAEKVGGVLQLKVVIVRNSSITETRYFDLWNNTGLVNGV